jgi:uncharacterized integral membrane protein
MRTIKLIVLGLLAVALVLAGVSNMGPVDLHLIPPSLAGGRFSLLDVPLAAVILASVLLGVFIGQVLEWIRGYKRRAIAAETRREIAALKDEVAQLRRKLGTEDDDLPRILGG